MSLRRIIAACNVSLQARLSGPWRSRQSNAKGFTLVESLLAIIVIAATVVAAGELLNVGLDSYALVTTRREALQEVRLSINLMTNELLVIANPATDIANISPNSITFTSTSGQVTYAVQAGNLVRTSGGVTNTLAENVTANTGFQYFTAGGGTTSNPAQVYRIHLAVEVDTGSAAYGVIQGKSNVYLRNRYYANFTQL